MTQISEHHGKKFNSPTLQISTTFEILTQTTFFRSGIYLLV